MNDRDQRRYDRLTRVQTFGRENAAGFTEGSKAPPRFKNIDQHLADLDGAKAVQNPARVSKETLLDALNLDFKKTSPAPRAPSPSTNRASTQLDLRCSCPQRPIPIANAKQPSPEGLRSNGC